jgi:hypothetical protein
VADLEEETAADLADSAEEAQAAVALRAVGRQKQ